MSVSAISTPGFPIYAPPSSFIGLDTQAMNQLIDACGIEVLKHRFQDSPDGRKQTPLCYAIRQGLTLALIERLLELGADVDEREPETGQTALHAFSQKFTIFPTEMKIFKLLLEKAKNINTADANGLTPFHTAASTCPGEPNWDVIQLLLEYGAEPYAKNCLGETFLDILIDIGKTRPPNLVENWMDKMYELINEHATLEPQEISLESLKQELNSLVQTLRELPLDFAGPGQLPNPLLFRQKFSRNNVKFDGVALLNLRRKLLNDVIRGLNPYVYFWKRSSIPTFSACFGSEDFAYLERLCGEDEKCLKLLHAKK